MTRFIEKRFYLEAPGARAEYLRRAAKVLKKTDNRVLAFALMGNHAHWVIRTGHSTIRDFMQPLNSGFAWWFNHTNQRIGPVFAGPYRSDVFIGSNALRLIAYVHNNPVRANIVQHASESDWTSHRAYLEAEKAPPWLDRALGLECCGFAVGETDTFDAAVTAMREDRVFVHDKNAFERSRRATRGMLSVPAEVSDPVIAGDSRMRLIGVSPGSPPLAVPVDVVEAIAEIAATTNISVPILTSRSRQRHVAKARRLAMHCWVRGLRRTQADMARALGVSSSSASRMVCTTDATPQLREQATEAAARIIEKHEEEKARQGETDPMISRDKGKLTP